MTLYIDFDSRSGEIAFERRTLELEQLLGEPDNAGTFRGNSLGFYQGLVESLNNRVFVPMLTFPWSFLPEPLMESMEYGFELLDGPGEPRFLKVVPNHRFGTPRTTKTGTIQIKLTARTSPNAVLVENYIEIDIGTVQEKIEVQEKAMKGLRRA